METGLLAKHIHPTRYQAQDYDSVTAIPQVITVVAQPFSLAPVPTQSYSAPSTPFTAYAYALLLQVAIHVAPIARFEASLGANS